MIEFDGWRVPPDFNNDGCTFAPDWVRVNLYPACNMHDFQCRHLVYEGILTVQEADWIFRRHLIHLGCPKLVARLYWIAVKLMRPFREDRAPLPFKWKLYASRQMQE